MTRNRWSAWLNEDGLMNKNVSTMIVSYLYYSDWVLHGVLSSKHIDPLVSSSHSRVQHSLRHGRHRLPLVEHAVVSGSIMRDVLLSVILECFMLYV